MVFSLVEGEELILSMLNAGRTLWDVEQEIEGMKRLKDEDRSVLWLLAWSERDSGNRGAENGIALVEA